jgi:hypothetical protein
LPSLSLFWCADRPKGTNIVPEAYLDKCSCQKSASGDRRAEEGARDGAYLFDWRRCTPGFELSDYAAKAAYPTHASTSFFAGARSVSRRRARGCITRGMGGGAGRSANTPLKNAQKNGGLNIMRKFPSPPTFSGKKIMKPHFYLDFSKSPAIIFTDRQALIA